MKRGILGLTWLAWACGGTPPPCDAETCAEACDTLEAAWKAKVPPGGELLTSYEARVLGGLLTDTVHQVALTEGTELEVCDLSGRCGAALAPADGGPLPAGTYNVRGTFDVPERGEWALRVSAQCAPAQTEPVVTILPVVYRPGGTRVDSLVTLVAPQPGRSATTCEILVRDAATSGTTWPLKVFLQGAQQRVPGRPPPSP